MPKSCQNVKETTNVSNSEVVVIEPMDDVQKVLFIVGELE